MIDLSGIPDFSIPAIDPQGDLVIGALVIAVALASLLRFRRRASRTRA
jgi:hypothetical protein